MKRTSKLLSMILLIAIMLSMVTVMVPASATAHTTYQDAKTELALLELAGTLEIDFDDIKEVGSVAGYTAGTDVLAGELKKSDFWWEMKNKDNLELVSDDKGGNALKLIATGQNAKGSGITMVFANPITSDYVLEVEYEATYASGTLDNSGVFLGNDEHSTTNNTATIGRFGGNKFSIDSGNTSGNFSDTSISANVAVNDVVKVKSIINLNDWRYNASVSVNDGTAVTNDGKSYTLSPFRYGTQTTPKGTSFSVLDFLAYSNGTMIIDNIKVNAYKYADAFAGIAAYAEDSFTGKTEGANVSGAVEKGAGSFGSWIDGTNFAKYTADGNGNMGISLGNVQWGTVNFDGGSNVFEEAVVGNYEFGMDFTIRVPATGSTSGSVTFDWERDSSHQRLNVLTVTPSGRGYLCKFKYALADGSEAEREFAVLEHGQSYRISTKSYPSTDMVYMNITTEDGTTTIYDGYYRHTPGTGTDNGIKDFRISEYIADNVHPIYDDFKVMVKEISPVVADALTENFDDATIAPYGKIYQFGDYEAVLGGSMQTQLLNGGMRLVDKGEGNKALTIAPTGTTGGNGFRFHLTKAIPTTKAITVGFDYTYGGQVEAEALDVVAANGTDIGFNPSNSAMRMINIKDGYVGAWYGGRNFKLVSGNTYRIEGTVYPQADVQRLLVKTLSGSVLTDLWVDVSVFDWANGQNTDVMPDNITDISFASNFSTYESTTTIDNIKIEVADSMIVPGFYNQEGTKMESVTAGKANVKIYAYPSAEEIATSKALVAYYAVNNGVVSLVDVEIIPITEENLAANGLFTSEITIPEGANAVKTFVWEMDTLAPRAYNVTLGASW